MGDTTANENSDSSEEQKNDIINNSSEGDNQKKQRTRKIVKKELPIEENLTQFGIELTNDQQFTFNKSYVEKRLGRSVIPGDIIKPEFQNLKYEVFEVQEDSFEMYGVYHLLCSAKLLRDSEDIHRQIVPTSDPIDSKDEGVDTND